ncbi:MAG: HU family DNA-binding protein [Bacteroidaceae bacterium]|nr:HU family DNA-binding protein [Bacteroidaceae bacterium]
MAVKYRSVKAILGYIEEKPQVWKVQKLTFPVIKENALVEYIANSAHIPKSTVKGCVLAISEAIAYFVINGHCVTFDSFGSFYLKVQTKVAQTLEECDANVIENTTLGFRANTKLAELANKTKVERAASLNLD